MPYCMCHILGCSAQCATCTDISTKCLSCNDAEVLQINTCQANCDDGWYTEAGSSICVGKMIMSINMSIIWYYTFRN